MSKEDKIYNKNKKHWEKSVENKNGYTQPWLELTAGTVNSFARGELEVMPEPYSYIFPQFIFKDVRGKNVLCLASGGGQQSAVFGLLGANVTVFDFSEGMLNSDREVAEKHGYKVETIQGDMRDLSIFEDNSFDIVYQAISIVYVSDLKEVYSEVYRILKNGGLYRIAHCNPATYYVEEDSWTGRGYQIDTKYSDGIYEDSEVIEFCHLLSSIFNGLISCGFIIKGVWEDPRHFQDDKKYRPGTYEHLIRFVQQYFAIVSEKKH